MRRRAYRVGTAVLAVAGLVAQLTVGLAAALPLWGLAAASLWLFRTPERAYPGRPLSVVSAADGRVTAAGPARDPYLERDALEVAVRVGLTGPFALRGPIEGRISELWGRPRGSTRPGMAICLETDEGDRVVLVIEPRLPWALKNRLSPGERLGHGRVYGSMPFGGTVRILVATHARTSVEPGERVRAGISEVAELLHD